MAYVISRVEPSLSVYKQHCIRVLHGRYDHRALEMGPPVHVGSPKRNRRAEEINLLCCTGMQFQAAEFFEQSLGVGSRIAFGGGCGRWMRPPASLLEHLPQIGIKRPAYGRTRDRILVFNPVTVMPRHVASIAVRESVQGLATYP